MPSKITFKIPTAKHGKIDATGHVALFPIGDKKVKFVLQDVEGKPDHCQLTHYASGMTAISVNEVMARKLTNYMTNPYSTPKTNREICQEILNGIISALGSDELIARLNRAEIINN